MITDINFIAGEPGNALSWPGPVKACIDDNLRALAATLDLACKNKPDAFLITVIDPESGRALRFRGQKAVTISGTRLAFRQMSKGAADLYDLLPPAYANMLTDKSLCSGGLLVVCGGPGAGKTTTLAATVAARLVLYGGMCVAAEDPPEIPLDGPHGDGFCTQIEISDKFPLESAIHSALRMFPVGIPSIILIGEVRSRAAADAAINAALNGTLVCMTLHASSQIDAMHRLVGLAGENDYVLSSIAASMRLILHQQLPPGGKIKLESLSVPATDAGLSIRNHIRKGKFELLATDIQMQRQALTQNRAKQTISKKQL